MSWKLYMDAIVRVRTWKDDGLTVDWSWPSDSVGEHLLFLFEGKAISELMRYNSEYDDKLRKITGENGYFYYKMLVSQRVPELPLR